MLRFTISCTLALLLVACSDDTSTSDTGVGDTGTSDTAVGDTAVGDTGGGDTAAGDTGGGDTGGGAEVARCEAASAALAATCPTDTERTCHAAALADFCDADARPGLLADGIDCLRESSDDTGCRTFSDPSGAMACVAAVYAGVSDAAVDTLVADTTALCGATTAAQTDPPLYNLTPAQLAAAQACVDGAADCDAVGACFATDVQAAIAACYE